jgi:ElaB/YqjD/DUF883 family membrane-anchored ribosome-binding protein
MENREQYLKSLKQEIKEYTKEISKIQKNFKGKTGEDLENILHSLQHILQEAVIAYSKLQSASAAEWEPMKKIASQAVANLRESVTEFLNSSSKQVKEYITLMEKQCHEQLECTAEYIGEHPFKSVLLAAGLGFIIGKILK